MKLTLENRLGKEVHFPLEVDEDKLIHFLLQSVTLVPNHEFVLREGKSGVYTTMLLGGRPITPEQGVDFGGAAMQMADNPVWKIITASVLEYLKEESIKHAEKPNEVIFFKAVSYLVAYQQSLLEELCKLHKSQPVSSPQIAPAPRFKKTKQ